MITITLNRMSLVLDNKFIRSDIMQLQCLVVKIYIKTDKITVSRLDGKRKLHQISNEHWAERRKSVIPLLQYCGLIVPKCKSFWGIPVFRTVPLPNGSLWHSWVEWFLKKIFDTCIMLYQTVIRPQIQNFTLKCCFLTWCRAGSGLRSSVFQVNCWFLLAKEWFALEKE